MRLNQKYINEIVTRALKEDLYPRGDITSNLLNNNLKIEAKIICNQNAIIAGINFAKTAFKYNPLLDNLMQNLGVNLNKRRNPNGI